MFIQLTVVGLALINILGDFRHPLTRITCFIIAFFCLLRMNLGLFAFSVILPGFAALERSFTVMLDGKRLFDLAALKKAEVIELERRRNLVQSQKARTKTAILKPHVAGRGTHLLSGWWKCLSRCLSASCPSADLAGMLYPMMRGVKLWAFGEHLR